MHTVMWEGADFQPISLAQLLQPEKVKLCYRKAMLVGSRGRGEMNGRKYIRIRIEMEHPIKSTLHRESLRR